MEEIAKLEAKKWFFVDSEGGLNSFFIRRQEENSFLQGRDEFLPIFFNPSFFVS